MKFLIVFSLTLCFSLFVNAATPDDDAAPYIKIFAGDKSLHHTITEDVEWMGLSDPKLFDPIEQRLLSEYEHAKIYSAERNRIARYIKDLGYSGQSKYIPTLKIMAADVTYERYAESALKDNIRYQKWNSIISNRANFDEKNSDDANRVANMLRADDLELNALGARQVYFKFFKNAYLVDLLAQKVKASYMLAEDAPGELAQAVAWMVRGLSSARDEKYYALVLKIESDAPNKTVRKHAGKSKMRDYVKKAAPKYRDEEL